MAHLRRDLATMVRRRVPERDVEDVIQATLVEALAADAAPAEPERLRRWVFGIARHKVVDLLRSRRREVLDEPEVSAEPDVASKDLLRWAERELPAGEEAKATLHLMLREGEGEPLEHLAAEAALPAAALRQRVSRLRRHFRARWAAQAAALAALGLGLFALVLWSTPPVTEARPVVGPLESAGPAHALRRHALGACAEGRYARCIDALDQARALDPMGDRQSWVQSTRQAAGELVRSSVTLPPARSIEPSPPRNLPVRSKDRVRDDTPMESPEQKTVHGATKAPSPQQKLAPRKAVTPAFSGAPNMPPRLAPKSSTPATKSGKLTMPQASVGQSTSLDEQVGGRQGPAKR